MIYSNISQRTDRKFKCQSNQLLSSEYFHQRFQKGELEDTINFFEWNTYYEMLTA